MPEGRRKSNQQGNPFEFRQGVEFQWRGMYTEGDPAGIPPNHFRFMQNTRFIGGDVTERPGLQPFSGQLHDPAACIRLIADYQTGGSGAVKLWILADGCPGISSSVGFSVTNLDQEQSPEYQRWVYYNGLSTSVALALFGGVLHIGSDDTLRKLERLQVPYGTEALSLAGSQMDLPIHTFDTDEVVIAMREFDSKLFMAIKDTGGADDKIVTWDGVSIVDDDTSLATAPADPRAFADYRIQNGGDALVCLLGANFAYRATGDPPTAWTEVTPGGTYDGVSAVPYKDKLWIASADGDIWSWDGSSATNEHTPTGATAIRGIAVFNGELVFCYETAGSGCIIGSYDGSTWTDSEKDLDAQFTSITGCRDLIEYRNDLYVGCTHTAGGHLYASPGTDLTGTYVEIELNSVSTGDINMLLAG